MERPPQAHRATRAKDAMRLVPMAALIWFASDFLLTRIPAPTYVACGCAVFGMCWITYVACRTAGERDTN
jgi:hypothetical protein